MPGCLEADSTLKVGRVYEKSVDGKCYVTVFAGVPRADLDAADSTVVYLNPCPADCAGTNSFGSPGNEKFKVYELNTGPQPAYIINIDGQYSITGSMVLSGFLLTTTNTITGVHENLSSQM